MQLGMRPCPAAGEEGPPYGARHLRDTACPGPWITTVEASRAAGATEWLRGVSDAKPFTRPAKHLKESAGTLVVGQCRFAGDDPGLYGSRASQENPGMPKCSNVPLVVSPRLRPSLGHL